MTTSRLAFYISIATLVTIIAYFVLVQEPYQEYQPDWTINIVHLFARH